MKRHPQLLLKSIPSAFISRARSNQRSTKSIIPFLKLFSNKFFLNDSIPLFPIFNFKFFAPWNISKYRNAAPAFSKIAGSVGSKPGLPQIITLGTPSFSFSLRI